MIKENNILRQSLKDFIIHFVEHDELLDSYDREYLTYIFFHTRDNEIWGSLVRGTMTLLINNNNHNFKQAFGLELIHHASLVIDDIIDSAHERRNYKCFWVEYGINNAILFAHKMINFAHLMLESNEKIYGVINKIIFSELNSQKCIIKDLDNYIEMARLKTGVLFSLPFLLNNVQEDLIPTIENIGILHQISDDFLDITNEDIFISQEAMNYEENHNLFGLLNNKYSIEDLYEFVLNFAKENISKLNSLHIQNKKDVIRLCVYFSNISALKSAILNKYSSNKKLINIKSVF